MIDGKQQWSYMFLENMCGTQIIDSCQRGEGSLLTFGTTIICVNMWSHIAILG